MKVLLCPPTYFDVLYQINPHMKVGDVDKELAYKQWGNLKSSLEEIGVECLEIEPVEGLPDMVFTANQSLPFLKDGKLSVLLSKMANDERKPEVEFFKKWYKEKGYEIYELPEEIESLEGMGDTLFHEERRFIWSAYGYRTTIEAHRYMQNVTGLEVKSLKLVDPAFYHLDVCLCPLGRGTALVYKPAFDAESYEKIESEFKNLILLTEDEAYNFAANAYSPDGKHVFLHPGSERVESRLRDSGFMPVSIDTSEFMKSGGSVFCMKMELP